MNKIVLQLNDRDDRLFRASAAIRNKTFPEYVAWLVVQDSIYRPMDNAPIEEVNPLISLVDEQLEKERIEAPA